MQSKLEESNARYEIQVRQTSVSNKVLQNLLCKNTTSPATTSHPFIFCITTHNQDAAACYKEHCPSVCLGSGNMQCANKTVETPKRGANTFATRGRGTFGGALFGCLGDGQNPIVRLLWYEALGMEVCLGRSS
jgi:hypothetical protein